MIRGDDQVKDQWSGSLRSLFSIQVEWGNFGKAKLQNQRTWKGPELSEEGSALIISPFLLPARHAYVFLLLLLFVSCSEKNITSCSVSNPINRLAKMVAKNALAHRRYHSSLAPGGDKMRDPGNEVEFAPSKFLRNKNWFWKQCLPYSLKIGKHWGNRHVLGRLWMFLENFALWTFYWLQSKDHDVVI